MIYFTSVKFKNILSTGNSWTEIKLDESKTTLIVGENGAGKSTILDAICFALYGKPFRKINKPQLINSINQKELEVILDFSIGKKKYSVRRGIKPNVFEIWCDGDLLNQDAKARDYQQYLEETVLKMNYKSFGQVVVLGSSTFVPFMQLPAAHRREVIEDLLDIQIFTTMNTLLKSKVSQNKEEISETSHQIELHKTKIDSAKSHNASIRSMKEGEVKRLKDKLKDQIAIVEQEQEFADAVLARIDSLRESIIDKPVLRKKHTEVMELTRELSAKQSRLVKEIQFYENHDNCPTCKQGIGHEFKESTVSDDRSKIQQIEDAREKLADKGLKLEKRLIEIDEVEATISDLSMTMSGHRANSKMAMNACKSIRDELVDAEKEVKEIGTEEIDKLEASLNGYHTRQEALYADREAISTVGQMLKDGGIKTRIIKQYVPVMNKLINKYLAAMDFFVQFELDESFNESIKSRFRDEFSYASFSEGEKLRIDLALLFTWRAVSKLRNSVSTNLLIMDEIMDSSLDTNGTDEFLKIITELTIDSNIFIISHKGDQVHDKFDRVIQFEKVKNFSRIAA